MALTGLVCVCVLLSIPCVVFGSQRQVECPSVNITHQFLFHFSNETHCLNFTGSSFLRVFWSSLRSTPNLQVLDASFCNITQIHDTAAGSTPASLREVYLNQNQLRFLPPDFLGDAVGLEVLDLGQNFLEELPAHFLMNAKNLRVLILRGNLLESLPASVLRLPLQQMDLLGNSWTCSCSFMKDLHSAVDQGNSSMLQGIVGNLICSSPERHSGKTVWSVHIDEVCRLSGLNALFILLPLLFLVLLMLCWCCGRKDEKKNSPKFGTVKNRDLTNESTKDNILKNQLIFRPSSALLGSTRDIYEEVEVKLGSVDSLGPPPSTSSGKEQNQELDSKQDLETVSVSEVMRDSADREKAYMTQSTKYYSLVPGLELNDSDHSEFENMDLS
ncbi:SLIT and NTRK-like protein 4 [Silurus meridionalis]|uniref:Uncharacterized protein n=1 Tax=Silurus meridionalis TaxID=175797 RepID=A0A8T0B614_SILME|nr:SLIT and NTRK-like protein 4 [Silurus meridionalis]KAF7700473.1 hypothetical protein HF521_003431 [Silurus meridionalis]